MQQKDGTGKKLITWMVVIVIALPVLGLFVSSVITYMMPKIYMSSAKVELVPSGLDVKKWGVDQYVATEMEVMRSDENLRLASQKIQLDVRWGIYEDHVVEQLSNIVTVDRVGDGRMIELTCRHRRREEAQNICKAVYEAYRDRKANLYFNEANGRVQVIKHEDRLVGNKLEELALELSHVNGTYKGDLSWIGEKRKVAVVQREHDAVLKKKQKLEKELIEAQRKAMMASQSMILHEIPKISDAPVSPNIPLNQAMGLIAGGVVACIIDAILLVVLLGRRSKVTQ